MGLREIIKMDLWGNQFSCCVLNGGIEMKCRIIKKITSPPSHVIMSSSRGSGLCHSAGGSAFDLTKRTPGLVQHSAAQKGGFHPPPHTEPALRTVCLSTSEIISRYCCHRKWRGGGDCCLDVRVGMKSDGGGCLEYVSQCSVLWDFKIKSMRPLHMNSCQNVPSALCMHNCVVVSWCSQIQPFLYFWMH